MHWIDKNLLLSLRAFKIALHLANIRRKGNKLIAWSALCAGALSCWKMKNSLEIWRVAGRNCCNSITLRLILLNNVDSVINKYQTDVMSTTCDSPTAAVSDWTLILCAQALCRDVFVIGWRMYAYSRSFCGFFGVVMVNFSTVNKMILTSLGKYFSATVLHVSLLYIALEHDSF